MQWIKEGEMVDSVDDLKSSCSIIGIKTPDFEVFDAKICFSTEQNHPWYPIQEKEGQSEGTKSPKEDRFLRGRQIAYLTYENFRVTGANGSVENFADLFTIVLRTDDIQEFDSKWDGIWLSIT